jgi:hypothetical protein
MPATTQAVETVRAYLSAGLHRYRDPESGELRIRTRAEIARELRIRKDTVCRAMRWLIEDGGADAPLA